jgi:hypothetical protein
MKIFVCGNVNPNLIEITFFFEMIIPLATLLVAKENGAYICGRVCFAPEPEEGGADEAEEEGVNETEEGGVDGDEVIERLVRAEAR